MEKLSQWTGAAKNEWQPIGETTAKLPPGIYNIAVSVTMFGDFTTLSGIEISTDKLIEVDDGISAHMLACSVIMEQPLASVASRLKNMHKPIVPGVQVVQVNSPDKTSNRTARAR